MSGSISKKDANALIEASLQLESSLQIFKEINDKANFIAVSAAIEGARMRSQLGTFSIVANQIALQASKNSELSDKLRSLVMKIETLALEAVAVRNQELAIDLIDKLDRNLFERNCDVQAWATFDMVKNAVENAGEMSSALASELLQKLVSIYVVYLNSLLVNEHGIIVACAKRPEFIGRSIGDCSWFHETLKGSITVTDLHFNDLLKSHSVLYCSPVYSSSQNIIGVLANCFDWEYALEMIDSAGYSEKTKALIIDDKANVIASPRRSQIMRDACEWMRAGEKATEKNIGFSLEYAQNGEPMATGFCYTKGYNSYRGKGWSALVSETFSGISPEIYFKANPLPNMVTPAGATTLGQHSSEIDSERSGKKLLTTMKEIDDLVFEINANNREVKLLAVNAAIQSGLAGPEGEGFGVIANEVANLAKKSLNFVEFVNASTNNLRKAVDHSTLIRLVDAATDTMSKIDRNLFERYCDIQAWSTFTQFQALLKKEVSSNQQAIGLLQAIHKIYEVYHDIYILSPEGCVVATAINQSLIDRDFSNREWFKSALNGETYFSDIDESETLKMSVINFSAPIYDEKKQIIGVIVSRFNCNFINDIIRAATIDSHTSCYLLNRTGVVIASAENGDVNKKNFSQFPVLARFQHGESGLEEKDSKDSYGYSTSKGYNSYRGQSWLVITQRPRAAAVGVSEVTPAEFFKLKVRTAA